MLNDNILKELKSIKSALRKSGRWPESLSGACNASSILVQAVFERNGIEATLVNNHKHSFNIIEIDGEDHVIDLTACQMSESTFPEDVVVKPWGEANKLAMSTFRGKGFYYMEKREGFFFSRGKLEDVLVVDENFKNDEKTLFRILESACVVEGVEVDLDIEINPENVNALAREIAKKLTTRNTKTVEQSAA